ncbi:MAG: WYL domain-containing protein [Clostridiales bacterium]|nr:WYL domain-containing protein [Clostridiales bacterium]
MFPATSKKTSILRILDILKKYSDENHRLSQKEIMGLLARDYGTPVDRKAVKRNLMQLLDFGFDLEYTETVRKGRDGEDEVMLSDWYLNRDFTDAELRLLIDSLLFSKHIPWNQCKALIEKLEGLSNTYFKAKVKHIRNMPEKLPENKELFYTIEVLDEAISARKMVAFHYNEYGTDKRPRPRRRETGEPRDYKVSPYQMAATNGRYYLICNRKHYPGVSNYRVDRISHIRIMNERATPMRLVKGLERGLDLPKHMAEHIYMFAGESVYVRFAAKRYITGDILDWFGRDVIFEDKGGDEVMATVRVNENAMFYWALQYGEHIEVWEPAGLRDRVAEAAMKISEKYL